MVVVSKHQIKIKYILLFTFFIVLMTIQVNGENKFSAFFLDEIVLSFNYTQLADANTTNGKGFGIGLYHSINNNKKIKAIVGVEYNQTNQLKHKIYGGHYIHFTDLNYKIHHASIPLSLRYFIVKSIFIEAGLFADLLIAAKTNGTKHRNLPSELEIIEKVSNNNLDLHLFNYGLQIDLGIKIPINNFELVLKPGYKYGFNVLTSGLDELYNRYWYIGIGLCI